MKSVSIVTATAAAAAVLCAATRAQSTVSVPTSVSPTHRGSAPLLTHSLQHLTGQARGPSRVQVVVDAAAIGTTPVMLRGLALFADNPGTSAIAEVTADLTITAGYSHRSPSDMSASTTRNRLAPMTAVRSGPFLLPRLDAGAQGTRVHVPFAQTFPFDPAIGNLLLEIVSDVPLTAEYGEVATGVFPLAHLTTFGTPGPISPGVRSPGIRSQIRLDPGSGMVRHYHALDTLDNVPVMVLFGFDGQQAGGLPLPLELSSFGAPGQTLLVNPLAILPGGAIALQSGCVLPVIRSPGASFHTPLTPSFQGAAYISQVVTAATNANAAGLVFSDASTTTMVAGNAENAQAIWSHPATELGRFLAPSASEASSFAMPILELDVGKQ